MLTDQVSLLELDCQQDVSCLWVFRPGLGILRAIPTGHSSRSGEESEFDDEEGHSANPVCAHYGRSPTRLGRGGYGARVGKGRELVDPPRIRMGEPGLAALDSLLQRTLPLRTLRRARVRDDRPERRQPLPRALGRGFGGRGRGGRSAGAVRLARNFSGGTDLRGLRREAPGARLKTLALRLLRSGMVSPRRPRPGELLQGDA